MGCIDVYGPCCHGSHIDMGDLCCPEAIVMSGSLLSPRATSGSVLLSMVTAECCAEVHDLSRSLKPCCLWAVLHLGLYGCW